MAADDPRAGLPAESTPGRDAGQGERKQTSFGGGSSNSRRIKTFGELARQITDWTSRLLVTLLILAAGLSFGLQVLQWWRESPSPAPSATTGDFAITPEAMSIAQDGEGLRVSTEQGHLSVITITGSEPEACRKAEEFCLAAAEKLALPQTPLSIEEQRLLDRLATAVPVRSLPDGTRVFRYPGDFPMWAIIKPGTSPKPGPVENHKDTPRGTHHGNSTAGINSVFTSGTGRLHVSQRVIGWAVLMRAGGNLWSLYVLTPEQSKEISDTAKRTSSGEGVERGPLKEPPVGAQWVARFAFSSENWVGIFEETVSGNAAAWPLWIDKQLSRDGWKAVGRWNSSSHESWKRYVRSGDVSGGEHLTVRLRTIPGEKPRGVVVYLRHIATPPDGD